MNRNQHISKQNRPALPAVSGFKGLKGIEYFDFEEDFVAKNVRCIPMIVRFKMDAVGIKLKLAEWSRFEVAERIKLAMLPAATPPEVFQYFLYLSALIKKYTGNDATLLAIDAQPDWANETQSSAQLAEKALEFGLVISSQQWRNLTHLQRFALLKLCRPGHENKNFPKAIKEFGLTGN